MKNVAADRENNAGLKVSSVRFSDWGGYSGEIADPSHSESLKQWIRGLDARLEQADAELIYRLRNRIFKLSDLPELSPGGVCLKAFCQPSSLRALYYARFPGKAEKSYRYARFLRQHGVGAPLPLAWGKRVVGGRLAESFLLTEYIDNPSDFLGEMARLYRSNPDYVTFLALLRQVAGAVRAMHDAGFIHNDLGGQNILLRRTGPTTWSDIQFIDLNRGKILGKVSLRQRARDMAKLDLPSFLREIFYHIYFGDAPIPEEFARWESLYRRRIDWHNRSRKYRHPIRTFRERTRKIDNLEKVLPHNELWLWDEKSGQPAILLKSRDRNHYRSTTDALSIAWHAARRGLKIRENYRIRQAEAWSRPVNLSGRVGMSFEPNGPDLPGRLALLEGLEGVPIMIRCHYAMGTDGLDLAEGVIRYLREKGHEVSLAIIQSRESIRHPERWNAFVMETLARLHTHVRFVEIGHAINRVKWGLWNLREMGSLWTHTAAIREKYPHLVLLGPAVNDFEFHYYPPLLGRWGQQFDGVSCHLYVDRRGAPENFQGAFSTLEKCALGRAMADSYGLKGFYVTEVNWPIEGSGDFSPVQASYNLPGAPEHPLHVNERMAAAYMIRFYLISLCSGLAERVWWWRLSARGFGLADDRDGHRKRVGWHTFACFNRYFGTATFLRYERVDSVHVYHFDCGCIAYATEPSSWTVPAKVSGALGLEGNAVAFTAGAAISLNDEPLFLLF